MLSKKKSNDLITGPEKKINKINKINILNHYIKLTEIFIENNPCLTPKAKNQTNNIKMFINSRKCAQLNQIFREIHKSLNAGTGSEISIEKLLDYYQQLEQIFVDNAKCRIAGTENETATKEMLDAYNNLIKIFIGNATNEPKMLLDLIFYEQLMGDFFNHAASSTKGADQSFINNVNNLAFEIYTKYIHMYLHLPEESRKSCSDPAHLTTQVFSFMNKQFNNQQSNFMAQSPMPKAP